MNNVSALPFTWDWGKKLFECKSHSEVVFSVDLMEEEKKINPGSVYK